MASQQLLVPLALLLLTGCALPESPPVGEPLSQRTPIVWVGKPPAPSKQQEILAYLDRAERVWLARFGGKVDVRMLVLYPGHQLPRELIGRPLRSGERLLGGTNPDGTVRLPWGGFRPLGATLHEFAHVAFGDGDHARSGLWREVNQMDWRLAWSGL